MTGSSQPLVSIITPSFNAARYLQATLDSVAEQDYRPIEHIVVDGASTDGTVDILRRAPAHVRWVSEPDRGHTDAWNKALRMVRGDIVGFMNADDTYLPGAVPAAVAFLQAHPQHAIVFADCHFIDGEGRVVDHWRTRPTTYTDLLLDGCVIAHQSAFFRREVLEAVGEFDTSLRWVMDYEYLLRCLRRFSAARVDAVWGTLRVWPGAKTSLHQPAFWPETVRMLERLFGSTEHDPALAAEVLRRAHLRCALAAAWAGEPSASAEFAQACQGGYAYGSSAVLAERIVTMCERPSYLKDTPEAAEARLDAVLRVPGLDRQLAAQLHAIRAFRAHRRGLRRRAGQHARSALALWPRLRRNRGLWSLWARSWWTHDAPAEQPGA